MEEEERQDKKKRSQEGNQICLNTFQTLRERYSTIKDLISENGVSLQRRIMDPGTEIRALVSPISPTIVDICNTYGDEGRKAVKMIIASQLYDLSEFCGARDKLTTQQIDEISEVIMARYKGASASQLAVFFNWCKRGCFGPFYGAVDAQRILMFFEDFIRKRDERIYDYLEKQENEKRKSENRENCITYEEYKKREKERREHGEGATY